MAEQLQAAEEAQDELRGAVHELTNERDTLTTANTTQAQELRHYQDEKDSLLATSDEREGNMRLQMESMWRERLGVKDRELADAAQRLVEAQSRIAALDDGNTQVQNALDAEQALRAKESKESKADRQTLSQLRVDLEDERRRRIECDVALRTATLEVEDAKAQTKHLTLNASNDKETLQGELLESDLRHKEQITSLEEQLANMQSMMERTQDEAQHIAQRATAQAALKETQVKELTELLEGEQLRHQSLQVKCVELDRKEKESDVTHLKLHEEIAHLHAEQRIREEALDVFYKESQQKERFQSLEAELAEVTERAQEQSIAAEQTRTALVEEATGLKELNGGQTQQIKDLEKKVKELREAGKQQQHILPSREVSRDVGRLAAGSSAMRSGSTPVIGHASVLIDAESATAPRGGLAAWRQHTKRTPMTPVVMGVLLLLLCLGFYNSSKCDCGRS